MGHIPQISLTREIPAIMASLYIVAGRWENILEIFFGNHIVLVSGLKKNHFKEKVLINIVGVSIM